MKVGIFGGTFNPPHLAHLRIAKDVLRTCGLERILFIPAAEPPHKDVADRVAFHHRYAMVAAAIAGYPQFEVTDLEVRRRGKSFSVDTLEILRREEPQGDYYFIIGLDSYRDIASWKEFDRLFTLSTLVVMTRPGVSVGEPLAPLPVAMHGDFCYDEQAGTLRHKSGNHLIFLTETCMEISSTQIRRMIAEGRDIRHLVPAGVAEYIEEHGLYRSMPHQRQQ